MMKPLTSILILLFLSCSSIDHVNRYSFESSKIEIKIQSIEMPKKVEMPPKMHERIFKVLVAEGIDTLTAKIIVSQASFESGYFKNPLTKNSNNCFALLHNAKRKTLAYDGCGYAEGRSGYAQFRSIEDAAKDFVYFLEYRKIGNRFTSITTYAKKLKQKNYYGSDYQLYAKGVQVHFKKIWS